MSLPPFISLDAFQTDFQYNEIKKKKDGSYSANMARKSRNIYTVAVDTRTIDLTFLACSLRAAKREESNLASNQATSRSRPELQL